MASSNMASSNMALSDDVVHTFQTATRMFHPALGTYKLRHAECFDITRFGLGAGVRSIDTAKLYGNEAIVQAAIEDSGVPRDTITVTTKLYWADIEQGRDCIIESTNQALQRLGNKIDVLLLHCPTENFAQAWDVLLNDVQGRDKVTHVGVSNFKAQHLEILDSQPFINQIEMSPFCPQSDTRRYCADNNIIVTAHSPLAKGHILGRKAVLQRAVRYNKPPAQVILNWIACNHAVPVFRTSSREHLLQNMDCCHFDMDPSDTVRPWSTHVYATHPKYI